MEEERSRKRNVYLVGPMGVGKTTIGKLLADEFNLDFVDTDREIETRAGADIPWIFDVEGEDGFRQRESRVLEEIALRSNQVVATGGGAILRDHNRRCMRDSGFCIYLMATLDQLVSRIGKDKKRPLLQVDNPRFVLEKVLQVRDPLYRELADLIVQTDSRPPRQVVKEISKRIRGNIALQHS